MISKPQQRSVAIVGAIRESINGTIDTLLDSLSAQSEQLERAFTAELAHLDDLYSDTLVEDSIALESVLRFDKGYAKTMAAIQAASERLIEAKAHLARITNTIEFHPAFTDNGCNKASPVTETEADIRKHNDAVIVTGDCVMTGKIHSIEANPTPGKTTEIKTTAPVIYQLGPITFDKHYPVSWVAIQDLINGHWPFSEYVREVNLEKSITISSFWQCPTSKIDARAVVNLTLDKTGNWEFEIAELSAKVGGKNIDYQPIEMEFDDKTILLIAPYACLVPEATTKENDHE